jgi:hypothetical protein
VDVDEFLSLIHKMLEGHPKLISSGDIPRNGNNVSSLDIANTDNNRSIRDEVVYKIPFGVQNTWTLKLSNNLTDDKLLPIDCLRKGMGYRIEPTFEGTLSFPLTFRTEVNFNVFTPCVNMSAIPRQELEGCKMSMSVCHDPADLEAMPS